ncbi:MAG: phosphatase PAP2 family protein [Sphaerochaetaceae bacterium]
MKTLRIVVVLLLLAVLVTPLYSESLFVYPYNKTLDIISDVTQYTSLLLPLSLAFVSDSTSYLELSLMYGSTVLLTYGSRTLLKAVVDRNRPYTNFDDYPIKDDNNKSFPSGHTAFAFASAAFNQTIFSTRYKESSWYYPITIGSWVLATTTAVLRVASGSHYVSDVLAGAAIGTLFGVGIPLITDRVFKKERIEVSVAPNLVAFNYSY